MTVIDLQALDPQTLKRLGDTCEYFWRRDMYGGEEPPTLEVLAADLGLQWPYRIQERPPESVDPDDPWRNSGRTTAMLLRALRDLHQPVPVLIVAHTLTYAQRLAIKLADMADVTKAPLPVEIRYRPFKMGIRSYVMNYRNEPGERISTFIDHHCFE